jgi:hypothetical protein
MTDLVSDAIVAVLFALCCLWFKWLAHETVKILNRWWW